MKRTRRDEPSVMVVYLRGHALPFLWTSMDDHGDFSGARWLNHNLTIWRARGIAVEVDWITRRQSELLSKASSLISKAAQC